MNRYAPRTRRSEDGIGYLKDPSGSGGRRGTALWGFARTVFFPWLGSAAHWLTLGRSRSDYSELAGVLLWPAILCLIGIYFAQLNRERARQIAGNSPRIDWVLKVHASLSVASLVALAVFEGGMVVTMSIYRWNKGDRLIAVYLFKVCLTAYVAHVVFALLAYLALRRVREVSA